MRLSGSAVPVYQGDFPDPFVLNGPGGYVAYGTNAGGANVQVMTSTDLGTWVHQGDALPVLAGWAVAGNTWAPSVLARGDGFVLYYTVREPRSGRQAISVATSSHPTGPFVDTSTAPLVFQLDQGGSIDPSPFLDAAGRPYLLWKADANALNRPSSLWGQPLSDDGVSLTGTATRLLDYGAVWEAPLIEGPSMVRDGDTYYLFYSANWWESPGYSIGYAVGPAPLGPFAKATGFAPWYAANAEVAGPGGQEFFTDADGVLHMAFHGWQPGRVGYPGGARSLRIVALTIDRGNPTIVS